MRKVKEEEEDDSLDTLVKRRMDATKSIGTALEDAKALLQETKKVLQEDPCKTLKDYKNL